MEEQQKYLVLAILDRYFPPLFSFNNRRNGGGGGGANEEIS